MLVASMPNTCYLLLPNASVSLVPCLIPTCAAHPGPGAEDGGPQPGAGTLAGRAAGAGDARGGEGGEATAPAPIDCGPFFQRGMR